MVRNRSTRSFGIASVVFLSVVVACGSTDGTGFGASAPREGGPPGGDAPDIGGGSGDPLDDESRGGDDRVRVPEGRTVDPATCEEAAASRSYVGCEYWPTITPNFVWSEFDFVVAVANPGTEPARVTVQGPNGLDATPLEEVVAPGTLKKLFLPWVADLKGGDWDACTNSRLFGRSRVVQRAAYRLVSSRPVIAYQFNPLQYSAGGFDFQRFGTYEEDRPQLRGRVRRRGGDPNDWATCPGQIVCGETRRGCFSFSNDASLLLPTTALTGNYRLAAPAAVGTRQRGMDTYAVVTATAPGVTTLSVQLGARSHVVAGDAVRGSAPGATLPLRLEQGDVAIVTSATGDDVDLSGSLLRADKPVQVISGMPCIEYAAPACDHVEETLLPIETLGTQYVVARPTAPSGTATGHIVKLVGTVDGTRLTYFPARPLGCPGTLNAGDVVVCNPGGPPAKQFVDRDFVVTGNHEFSVITFQLGGSLVDRAGGRSSAKGDPSQSNVVAIPQFRTRYLFLAPTDYDESFVDIVTTRDAEVRIDGELVAAPFEPIAEGLGIRRAALGKGRDGVRELTSTRPAGIQVIGYGTHTSYQYPGGLNLRLIAPPPR